jgi:glutamate formiminotransferase
VALPLESVPNFSAARDLRAVEALRTALSSPARLLDVHVDADHNRSVFTLVGSSDELVETLAAGIRAAVESIDLRAHEGVHPRVGAADVVPLVPIRPRDEADARAAAGGGGGRGARGGAGAGCV